MSAGSLKLEGFAGLERALDALGPKVAVKVLKAAVKASGGPVKKAAKSNAPRSTGLLRLSIGDRTVRSKRAPVAYTVIGARISFKGKKATDARSKGVRAAFARPANYAHLVEFGTAEHWIRARKQGVLSFAGIITKVVRHPGSRPQPFMRSAFNASQRRALSVMGKKAWSGIAKEAKRVAAV